MRSAVLSLATLLIPFFTQAALLTTEGDGKKIEGVTLAKSATAKWNDSAVALSSVGGGLRAKKVVFVNVRVYVAQLYVSSLETFKKEETSALASVKDQKTLAIQLHFLRDVDAKDVQSSFKQALTANKVNLEDAAIKQFLENVEKGGNAAKGKTLTILGSHEADGKEVIHYENTDGAVSTVQGSQDFIKNIFSIWLGTPADDGVAKLKSEILK
ncbi:MAG: chalcone isomerase family protein [Bdellovibrio sp.]